MPVPTLQPSAGWTFDLLVFLEVQLPARGLAARFATGTPQQRQSMAVYLGRSLNGEAPAGDVVEAARSALDIDLLLRADPRRLIASAIERPPAGFVGALGRIGPNPLAPAFYDELFRALAANGSSARVLRQLRAINETTLQILEVLPPDLHIVRLVERLNAIEEAREVRAMWRLFQRHDVATAECLHCLRQAARAGDPLGFLWTWSHRIAFPLNPVPESPNYKPVRDGRELRRLGRTWRNCAASLLIELLDGYYSLALMTLTDGREVIVQIERHDGGYRLVDVLGSRNRRVPSVLRQEVEAFVMQFGVKPRLAARHDGEWAPLRKIANRCIRWLL
jgi:hypothetical protein